MNAAKYIGEVLGTVRLGDRPVAPGQVVDGPPELVAHLLERGDFIATELVADLEEQQAPEPKRRRAKVKE